MPEVTREKLGAWLLKCNPVNWDVEKFSSLMVMAWCTAGSSKTTTARPRWQMATRRSYG